MNENLRVQIQQALEKSHYGLSTREIVDDLEMRFKPVINALKLLEKEGFIENCKTSADVQIWKITQSGLENLKKEKAMLFAFSINEKDIEQKTETNISVNNFEIFQIMDDAREKIIKYLESIPMKKPINNLETKIKTIEGLADITSPQISKVLNSVILDLRGSI